MDSLQAVFRAQSVTVAQDEILSRHPEILAIFLDISQFYRENGAPSPPLQSNQEPQRRPRNWNSAIVVKTKDDIFTLVNEHRKDLMDIIGVVREQCTETEFQVPSASSQLWPEFNAVRFAGYDQSSAKRSATILSLDYFSQSKTSLNILSYEDKRIYKVIQSGPRSPTITYQIQQATLLPNQLYILHDQWVFQTSKPQNISSVTFGPTTDLLVSGACVVGRDQYGLEIKGKLLQHYSQISRQRATPASLGRKEGFTDIYVEWLNQEFDDACPTCNITEPLSTESEDHTLSPNQPLFSFGETKTIRMIPHHDFSSSANMLPLEVYKKFEDGLISENKTLYNQTRPSRPSPYTVTTTGDPDTAIEIFCKEGYDDKNYTRDEFKRAQSASVFYPRIQVPRISIARDDLLYPFFTGLGQASYRFAYNRVGGGEREIAEKILYMEMVKAEDMLRAYRKSLSQNIVENANRKYEIQEFFSQNSANRTFQESYDAYIPLSCGDIRLHRLMGMQWSINGQVYPSLSTLLNEASQRLSSASLRESSCPLVFGLGDVDGGRVMLASDTPECGRPKVLFINHRVGEFHPVMLDLAIPLYKDLFFIPQYGEDGQTGNPKTYASEIKRNTLFVNFEPQIDSLTQALFDIKMRYLIQPFFEEARKLGYSLDDHVPILSSALLLYAISAHALTMEDSFISSFAIGIILSTSKDWEGFLANLEKLGFATP
ncbi:hypothetical protein M434DRAFT_14132 [Hypoxylon sp. CO27-5]|nr:hypothetical protein M434DRAFT_14132 [Hypoxylon sp. CO27-5]